MLTFAILDANNVVINVIVADSLEIAQNVAPAMTNGLTAVEYTENNPAFIGWTYDGTTFINPDPQP